MTVLRYAAGERARRAVTGEAGPIPTVEPLTPVDHDRDVAEFVAAELGRFGVRCFFLPQTTRRTFTAAIPSRRARAVNGGAQ